jgi:hypothetical protein
MQFVKEWGYQMKNQKTIKTRDPNWRDMEALRKSGAAGSHRDKKKEMKLGKVKHKGKTMDESIYTNPAGGELSKIGRILMDKSVTVKDDALSNVLGRVGDELTRYGDPGGATSIDELCKKARCSKEQLMKMMKWAQQQKDTSLDKVKDPDPKPDDEDDDDKEESMASETSIGHVDDERHMIRKELYQAAKYAKELFTMLEDLPEDSDFPHWWQSKVTKSLQMLSKAKHYLENELAVPDQNTDESGIMYKAGVKKYGKDGMQKIQSAAGKGASAEEIGAIKDKHNKKKTESESVDSDLEEKSKGLYYYVNKRKKAGTSRKKGHPDAPSSQDWKNAAKTAKESVCSECGKARFVALPEEMQKQYESVNEAKQKGVDGKVCWKGYKRMGTKKKGGKTVDNCVKM